MIYPPISPRITGTEWNVLDHGAPVDGTGDIGAHINSAISLGYKTILLPAITAGYRLSTSIAMDNGARIYGINGRPVIKRAASTAVDMFGIYSKSNWWIENIELDGNSANSGTGKGIYTNTCTNGTLKSCKIYGQTQDCMNNYAGTRLQVDGLEFSTTSLHGLFLDGHKNGNFRNIYGNGTGGFVIYGTTGADHNQFTNISTDSSVLEMITLFGDHNTIVNARATNCQDNGITLVGNYNELTNYTGYLNYHNGIHINGNYNMLSNIVCYNNNQPSGSGTHSGLKIESGYGGEAKGNQVSNVQLYDTQGSPTQNGGVTLGANGYNQWVSGATVPVATNPYLYYGNNAYSATGSGTLGGVAPSHTSGSASNGGYTLTFLFTTSVSFHATDNLCTNIKYRNNKTANKIDNATSGTNSGF